LPQVSFPQVSFPQVSFPQVSGFRLSLTQRLLAAACLILPLWAAVIWAIR
jgi:hypothetical protein